MARRKLTKAEAGRLGGRATLARHGTEHFRRLGALGFAALAKKLGYAGGSRLGALQQLTSRGKIPQHNPKANAEAEAFFRDFLDKFDPEDPHATGNA